MVARSARDAVLTRLLKLNIGLNAFKHLQHGTVATLVSLVQLLLQPAHLLAQHVHMLLQRAPLHWKENVPVSDCGAQALYQQVESELNLNEAKRHARLLRRQA